MAKSTRLPVIPRERERERVRQRQRQRQREREFASQKIFQITGKYWH